MNWMEFGVNWIESEFLFSFFLLAAVSTIIRIREKKRKERKKQTNKGDHVDIDF